MPAILQNSQAEAGCTEIFCIYLYKRVAAMTLCTVMTTRRSYLREDPNVAAMKGW